MAILKKGLLGTPKGKIGSIMGYQRNGKGVLQHVPTVISPNLRRSNLNRRAIKDYVSSIWQYIPISLKNRWTAFNHTTLDNEEYYNQYNSSLAKENTLRNITGLVANPPYRMNWFKIELTHDVENEKVYMTLPQDHQNQHGNNPTALILLRLRKDTPSTSPIQIPYVPNQFAYVFDISGYVLPTVVCVLGLVRWSSPTTQSQYNFIDIVNVRN